ncbi:MAG TPA: hypothetical protein VN704_04185 [Verrucomicrobiae bacterium]|nr:hypothetical protein [Verrucomicrobiae bacterium]
MINDIYIVCRFSAPYDTTQKATIFQIICSLDNLFDNIHDKEISKRWVKHKIQRLSKEYRKRETVAGRPFKLNLNNMFPMLLIYYCLNIINTLVSFLFDTD